MRLQIQHTSALLLLAVACSSETPPGDGGVTRDSALSDGALFDSAPTDGQLPDGTAVDGSAPDSTTGLPLFDQPISAANGSACEVFDDGDDTGHIRCWGSIALMGRWPTEGGFVSVHTTTGRACGLRADGTGQCFDAEGIVDIPSAGGPYAKVRAMHNGVCLLSQSGTLTCYEGHFEGDRALEVPTTGLTDFASYYDDYRDVVCVIDGTHQLHCQGSFWEGSAQPPADLGTVDAIDVNILAACALTDEGAIRCWGEEPPAVEGGPFQSIALSHHLCALDEAGHASCWRSNGPLDLPDSDDIAFLTMGGPRGYTPPGRCAIYRSGERRCDGHLNTMIPFHPSEVGRITMGVAIYQQALLLNDEGRVTATQDQPPSDLPPLVEITGQQHAYCGRSETGAVHCWGVSTTDWSLPDSPPPASAIGASTGGVCILHGEGRVRCWGDDTRLTARYPSSPGYVQVDVGDSYSCARSASGSVDCWGYSRFDNEDPPSDLPEVVDVDTGRDHACALTRDGTVRCWGHNDEGQRDVPPDLTNIVDVDAGGDTSCALQMDGRVRCWGEGADRLRHIEHLHAIAVDVGTRSICLQTADGLFGCVGERSLALTGD